MNTRDYLRAATRKAHDELDRQMSGDLSDRASYTRFLQAQFAARLPIESWIAAHCAADLAPPPQIHLIRGDLAELNAPFSQAWTFAMAADADPLGVAWVIAGSHLGNRAMLASLPKNHDLPTRFLADDRMIGFWKRLRPVLEQEAPQEQLERALTAAEAVFALFLKVVQSPERKIAA